MTLAYTSAKTEDTAHDAISRMRGAGFTVPESPPVQPSFANGLSGMPYLPEDPTVLSEEEVMTLFFAFTEWTSYAETSLWVAQCDEGVMEAKAARARGGAIFGSTARTVTEQKLHAAGDPRVMQLEDELYAQTCLRKGLETVYRRCERNAAAMSRELSRRGFRASVDRRSSKWGS